MPARCEAAGGWGPVNGKRDGVGCSITAARHMFVEQYVAGELKAKTKWKIDKEHKQCAHCKGLYVEATNKLECRYHPDGVDWEARGWPPPSHPQ